MALRGVYWTGSLPTLVPRRTAYACFALAAPMEKLALQEYVGTRTHWRSPVINVDLLRSCNATADIRYDPHRLRWSPLVIAANSICTAWGLLLTEVSLIHAQHSLVTQ